MELSYQVVLIEGHPAWSGRAKHFYGHLLFLDIASGVHDVRMLQIAHPEAIPHGIRCEGLLRVLSWVSFDLPVHLKGMVGALLRAAGGGDTELHTVTIQGRDIRNVQPSNEVKLQMAIIDMIPVPGGSQNAGGQLVRDLLAEKVSHCAPCYFCMTWSFHSWMHTMQGDTYSTCSPGPV